jgi:preprotein translocase subunit SecY
MFKTLKNAWKIPELKNKLLFTLLIIILYRVGSAIPVPYFEYSATLASTQAFTNGILGFLSTLSGGALAQGTLLALGVSPYITASIVMQLLTIAIPPLERLSKEGEEGKKKINFYTRITTVILSVITAVGYTMFVINTGANGETPYFHETNVPVLFAGAVMVLCYCAGAMLVMWLAEKINDHGIGNGISIILFANIVAGFFQQAGYLYNATFTSHNGGFNYVGLIISIVTVIVLLGLLMMIVWMSDAERRIPINYAKRVVGRKMYGGQTSNLPIKVNMSGVMPIIFANSIVAVPATIRAFMGEGKTNWFTKFVDNWFNYNTAIYLVVFLVLLVAFAYFYVAISFNPVEVANNIKTNGGAIAGIRPGKPTTDFIKKVLGRITLVGALLVAVIACVPMLAGVISTPIANAVPTSLFAEAVAYIGFMAFGGSSLMIVVGVALETTRELEAQMSLRNYKGFLD